MKFLYDSFRFMNLKDVEYDDCLMLLKFSQNLTTKKRRMLTTSMKANFNKNIFFQTNKCRITKRLGCDILEVHTKIRYKSVPNLLKYRRLKYGHTSILD